MFQAMIFAAGLGSRLKPLTLSQPKALVQVNGVSLLEHNIKKLIDYGCKHIIINIHHFPHLILEHINKKHYKADIFISDETNMLLDTGKGLVNAKHLFDFSKDILIHNVDIISKIDFSQFYNYHKTSDALATLAVSQRETSRYLLFNKDNQLCGWQNTNTNDLIISREDNDLTQFGFSGIQLIKPELLDLIDNKEEAYPIIPEYLKLATNHSILSFVHSKDIWVDVGKMEAIPIAEELLLRI
jgi:NDP-sugar pyrophosphorylase family protein